MGAQAQALPTILETNLKSASSNYLGDTEESLWHDMRWSPVGGLYSFWHHGVKAPQTHSKLAQALNQAIENSQKEREKEADRAIGDENKLRLPKDIPISELLAGVHLYLLTTGSHAFVRATQKCLDVDDEANKIIAKQNAVDYKDFYNFKLPRIIAWCLEQDGFPDFDFKQLLSTTQLDGCIQTIATHLKTQGETCLNMAQDAGRKLIKAAKELEFINLHAEDSYQTYVIEKILRSLAEFRQYLSEKVYDLIDGVLNHNDAEERRNEGGSRRASGASTQSAPPLAPAEEERNGSRRSSNASLQSASPSQTSADDEETEAQEIPLTQEELALKERQDKIKQLVIELNKLLTTINADKAPKKSTAANLVIIVKRLDEYDDKTSNDRYRMTLQTIEHRLKSLQSEIQPQLQTATHIQNWYKNIKRIKTQKKVNLYGRLPQIGQVIKLKEAYFPQAPMTLEASFAKSHEDRCLCYPTERRDMLSALSLRR